MGRLRPSATSGALYALIEELEHRPGAAVSVSNGELCARLGLTIRPVQRALAELVERGRITVTYHRADGANSNRAIRRVV